MNILILSAGMRIFIVTEFMRALKGCGRVIAADKSYAAPALYEADAHYIIPGVNEAGYVDAVIDICKRENIRAVFSLIDSEQAILSGMSRELAQLGVVFVGSPVHICDIAYDKRKMNCWLASNGFDSVKIYSTLEMFRNAVTSGEVKFPVIIKPYNGSASVNCIVAEDMATAELFLSKDRMIAQEFIEGEEIGADIYADMLTGTVTSVFLKNKFLMKAGETYKGLSIRDDSLTEKLVEFAEKFGIRGPADVDVIRSGDKYYIIDVNPRFGGGYPFAHLCGCDHIKMIVDNINGISVPRRMHDYEYDVLLMKYVDVIAVGRDEFEKSFSSRA